MLFDSKRFSTEEELITGDEKMETKERKQNEEKEEVY